MLRALSLQLSLISCIRAISSFHNLYAPWIPFGIIGVKGANLDLEFSLRCKYCCWTLYQAMSAQPGTKKALPDVQIFISFWLSILDKIVKPSIVPRTLFAMFFQAQFSNCNSQ